MDIKTAIMSEKGQIVIPDGIRKRMNAAKGTRFAIVSGKDTIILKKLHTPTREELLFELKSLTKEISDELRGLGVTEEDVVQMAVAARRKH